MTASLPSAQKTLQQVFGLTKFRPHQTEIIKAILAKQDVLAILPTGGGKSLCFQIPALLFPGLTLVITPLISLMVNQVTTLKRHQVAAACWHSQLTSIEEKELLEKLRLNQLKLLYLSPEKLNSTSCNNWLKTQKINLVVLDEAHCLALWGFDFRPSYLKIANWLKIQSSRPQVLALTATATIEVKQAIISGLSLIDPFVYQQSSVRTNIALQVLHRSTPITKLISLLTLCLLQPTETILIYCATRVEVENLVKNFKLYQPQLRLILKYHGGLAAASRTENLQKFLATSNCIMIATNAFGMGIDKPNIRLVIHAQLPSNLENYAQEIGRASRDGQPAKAVLIVSDYDWEIQLGLAKAQPHHHLKMSWLKHYCLTQACRTQTLASYFNEQTQVCGQCDLCRPQKFIPPQEIWQKYSQLVKLKIPYRKNLKLLALTQPQTLENLAKLPGIGPNWLDHWGAAALKILAT